MFLIKFKSFLPPSLIKSIHILSGPGADKLFSLLIAARTSSIVMLLLLVIKSLELIISLSLFSKLILKLSSKLLFDFDLSICVSLSIFDISGLENVYLFCPVCNGSTMFLPFLFLNFC